MAFSVIEAAALGVPCLLSRPADPMGLFEQSEAAFVVEPQEREIVAALKDLDQTPRPELRRIGARGQEIVRTTMTLLVAPALSASAACTINPSASPITPASDQ